MTELTCKIHNINLKCMGGRNAHRSNWYCPKCDEEKQPPVIPDIIELLQGGGKNIKYILLNKAIEILEAEPETIQSSTSYQQGYVRATRDKVKLLREIINE